MWKCLGGNRGTKEALMVKVKMLIAEPYEHEEHGGVAGRSSINGFAAWLAHMVETCKQRITYLESCMKM